MAVTGVSAQYLPQVAIADLLEMISRAHGGQRRPWRSPASSPGRRQSPSVAAVECAVRGLLLEDGRTSGFLTRAQAEGVRVVGERPASQCRGAMAEEGRPVGCAEQQRQHVDGPEDPEIAVSGGRLTEVA